MNKDFERDLIRRENKRLNYQLKDNEKFCPTCGRIIKKSDELCRRCRGKEQRE